jgi:hypothetical protein
VAVVAAAFVMIVDRSRAGARQGSDCGAFTVTDKGADRRSSSRSDCDPSRRSCTVVMTAAVICAAIVCSIGKFYAAIFCRVIYGGTDVNNILRLNCSPGRQ